jgi:hypothetical protein
LNVDAQPMIFSAPKCTPIDAPSMAVPPEPLVVAEHDLMVVYRASPEGDKKDQWVVARFEGYLQFTHGYPNDEALGAHPLAKYGLKFYDVFEVSHSPLIDELKKRNSVHPRHSDALFAKDRHWVFTFQDETLEVISRDAPTFEVVSAASASDALQMRK